MAFALIFAGIILTVSAVRNTHGCLYALLKRDFTGQGNFIYWIFAVFVVGSIGYIPTLTKLSRAFLALMVLSLFLVRANPNGQGGGFFAELTQALGDTQSNQSISTTDTSVGSDYTPPATNSSSSGTSSGIGSFLGSLASFIPFL